MFVPHLLNPFVHQWALNLLTCLGYCKYAAMNTGAHASFQIRVFSRYIPRIAGSYGNFISFKKKTLRKAVFHSYCLSKSFLWDYFFLCPQRNIGRLCHSSVQTRATQIVLPSLQVTQHPVRMVTNVSSPAAAAKSLQLCQTL